MRGSETTARRENPGAGYDARTKPRLFLFVRGARVLGLAMLAAAVGGGSTLAADSKVAIAPPPVEDALDAFVRQLGAPQRARVESMVKAAGTNSGTRQTALFDSLLLLNPDLSRASDELNSDWPTNALPILDRLSGSPDPYLATHAAWLRVRAFANGSRFEDALSTLGSMRTNALRYSLLAGDMLYTEGFLRACLLDRTAATAALQRYLDEFPDAPEERRGAAEEALKEIRRIRPNSLPEVAAMMNDSKRRLQLGDFGEATLARQRQISAALDKVIELEELKQSTAGARGSKSMTGKGSEGKSGRPDKAEKGAKESKLGGNKPGEGDLGEEPPEGGNPDDWAQAYARDREAVRRELQYRTTERYRELIEQYYRSLSDEGGTIGESKAEEQE